MARGRHWTTISRRGTTIFVQLYIVHDSTSWPRRLATLCDIFCISVSKHRCCYVARFIFSCSTFSHYTWYQFSTTTSGRHWTTFTRHWTTHFFIWTLQLFLRRSYCSPFQYCHMIFSHADHYTSDPANSHWLHHEARNGTRNEARNGVRDTCKTQS